MTSFRPRVPDPELAARLTRELGVHPVTAQVLANRGFKDPQQAREFLRPGPDQLHDPWLFRDMKAAVDLLKDAVRNRRRIAVYGDYDVDGVSATTVMIRTLKALGADPVAFIPERLREGYGLNADALLRLGEQGCEVVVTVDNGTSRPDEIAAAQAAGLQIIVTDHHEQGARLPDCPVINPKRHDSTYPFGHLAGCGVAFKLATALAEGMGLLHAPVFKRLLPDLLAVVAIATIADVVDLVDENRSLVALGLKTLRATQHAGLRALLEVARCSRRPLRPSDIGFRIGPRINAAGRLGSAHLALDLLLCEEPERARELATRLDEGNVARQAIERAQAEQARQRAEQMTEDHADVAAIVLSDLAWHPGVIGIVAARVAETFHRPAAMIAADGDEARGSARAWGHVRLHEALEACSEHLLTHGGHAAAAGFTLRTENIDAFSTAFCRAVEDQGPEPAAPRKVDAELPIEAISLPLAKELALLQPFGMGNPEPVFCAYGLTAAGRSRRSANERHLTFYAATDRASVRAVAFNQAEDGPLLEQPFDISFQVRQREGPEPVEIVVKQIVATDPPRTRTL